MAEQSNTSESEDSRSADDIDILYLEDDETERTRLAQFLDRDHPDLTLSVVETLADALAVFETTGAPTTFADCVVLEYGVDDVDGVADVERLQAVSDVPVVLYTRVDVAEMDAAVFDAAETVVQKGKEVHRRFLVSKIRSVTGDTDNTDHRFREIGSFIGDEDVTTVVTDDSGQVHRVDDGVADLFPAVRFGEAVSFHEQVAEQVVESEAYREQVADAQGVVAGSLFTVGRSAGQREVACWRVPVPDADLHVAFYRDVSDDADRVEQLERLETLVELSEDALYTIDAEARYNYLNEATTAFLGYDREELLGSYYPFTMAEGALRKGQRAVQEVIESGEATSDVVDQRHVTGDGEEVVGAGHFGVLYRDDGSYDGLAAVVRDVTERKEREQRLRQYRRLVEQAQDPMYVIDDDGDLSLLNDAVRPLVDEAETGQSFEAVVDADWWEAHERAVETLRPGEGDEETFEVELRDKNGNDRWFEVSVGLLEDDGTVAGSVASMHDVTDLKRQERTLREREREVREKNQRLEEFADMITHNLRNPHHIASQYLDLARESDDPADIERVVAALDRMDRIIENLLTYARLSDVDVDPQLVSLRQVVTEAWESTDDRHAVEAPDGVTVHADERLLALVLETVFEAHTNCLSEASPASTVRVGTLADGDGIFVAGLDPAAVPDQVDGPLADGPATWRDSEVLLAIIEETVETHGWTGTVTTDDGHKCIEITGMELRQ